MEKTKQVLYGLVLTLFLVMLGLAPAFPGVSYFLKWDGMGARLAEAGVIDTQKLEELYDRRGGLSAEDRKLLEDTKEGKLDINSRNAAMVLNMLWALGLGNKNPVLEQGPMMDPSYGGAENFASTGGWILARGEAMDHYSKHEFIRLTPEEQKLVEQMAKNIFRPCCGNSTHFPDCNHGMAMLGLLELMASQGASEADMYRVALEANSLWFPGQYETIKAYFTEKGENWSKTDPKLILSAEYSSSHGFQKILSQVQKKGSGPGSNCGA